MNTQDMVAAHTNGLKSSIHALEVQITILKQLIGETPEAVETEEESFEAPKATKKTKPAPKAAASFGDEEEEETQTASDDAPEDEEEEKPKKTAKATKAKKLTTDDINDACKAKVTAIIEERGCTGPEARKEVLKLLKKGFGVTSVSELDPSSYAAVIEAMS